MRWFQMGVFTPVLRTHSQYLPEPYQPVYKEYHELLKACIAMRSRLLPYTYSLAWRNTTEGIPITAPLNLYTEESKLVADLDSEYLFGLNILVAPISEPGAKGRDVVLPSGEWVDMLTMHFYEGNRTISFAADDMRMPVFLRCGIRASFRLVAAFVPLPVWWLHPCLLLLLGCSRLDAEGSSSENYRLSLALIFIFHCLPLNGARNMLAPPAPCHLLSLALWQPQFAQFCGRERQFVHKCSLFPQKP